MVYCVSDTCLFSMWTYCALMPLAQTIEIMLYRRGMLVREDLKKEKKKSCRRAEILKIWILKTY